MVRAPSSSRVNIAGNDWGVSHPPPNLDFFLVFVYVSASTLLSLHPSAFLPIISSLSHYLPLPIAHPTATMAAAPTLPPVESTDSFNPDFNTSFSGNSNGHDNADGLVSSPVQTSGPSFAASAPSAVQPHEYKPDPQIQQKVQDVLHSDIGVNTLLNRLKASIASARVYISLPLFQLPGC